MHFVNFCDKALAAEVLDYTFLIKKVSADEVSHIDVSDRNDWANKVSSDKVSAVKVSTGKVSAAADKV